MYKQLTDRQRITAILLVGLAFISILFIKREIRIENVEVNTVKKESPQEIIERVAEEFDLDSRIMVAVAKCESGLRHDGIYGDGGRAYGVAQFHRPTFEHFKVKAGMPELQYEKFEDQIILMAWMFSNGLQFHWTCYQKVVR